MRGFGRSGRKASRDGPLTILRQKRRYSRGRAGQTDQGTHPIRDWLNIRFLRRGVFVFVGVIGLIWILGLVAFATGLGPAARDTLSADAIVALTGGEERISEALELLEAKKAERLLISGVNPQTPNEDIQKLVGAPQELFDCCVDFDRSAANTIGNAEETAAWAQRNGYRSLIVVTADYHMPRSLLEFRHAMPETELIAYPIRSPRFPMQKWYHFQSARILVSEYNKYLISFVRIQIFSTLGF